MLDRSSLLTLIKSKIQDQIAGGAGAGAGIDEETPLFGEDSVIDSMALVNVLLDVEQEINGQLGTDLLLASDRAMSEKVSPFSTPGRLADYVTKLIAEATQQK